MITLTLSRYLYHPACTIGDLSTPYGEFKTLEPPWKDNAHNDSCIPLGSYRLRGYRSPKHGFVLMVHNVPDRELIEIHAGNYAVQTRGCILIGVYTEFIDSVPSVQRSDRALERLLKYLPSDEWMLLTVSNAHDVAINSTARICDRNADFYRVKITASAAGGAGFVGDSGRADDEHIDPDVKPSDQE